MAGALGRCQVCRRSVLDSFAALAGVRIPIRTHTSPQQRPRQPLATATPPARLQPFHSGRSVRQSNDQLTTATDSEQPVASSDAAAATTAASAANVPWYLQVETPTPPATPASAALLLASKYDIPAVPADAPPIVPAILEHLSTSIGLSELRLLDLRDVWPPPALGANLLMIIGTARSTKHLNVSADRLCRWLRSAYRLRPYADGLLGRQELKLKLRRRARKMKMAQAVGRTDEMAAADDVTTGWICVNVGAVPQQQVAAAAPVPGPDPVDDHVAAADDDIDDAAATSDDGADDDYAGFGSSETSPRVVVQMFTEDKRLEMDLEGLWDFRNARRQSKQVAQPTSSAQQSVWPDKLHETESEVVDIDVRGQTTAAS